MDRIHRVTMFKIPKKEDQEALIQQYRHLVHSTSRGGKPYILSAVIGPAEENPLSQGYTVISKTQFANMDDMNYYADFCPAHQKLKDFTRTIGFEGVLTVFFTPHIVAGASVEDM